MRNMTGSKRKLSREQVLTLRRVAVMRAELRAKLDAVPTIAHLAAEYGVALHAAQKAANGLTHKLVR